MVESTHCAHIAHHQLLTEKRITRPQWGLPIFTNAMEKKIWRLAYCKVAVDNSPVQPLQM